VKRSFGRPEVLVKFKSGVSQELSND
jgi:hypothetical protein